MLGTIPVYISVNAFWNGSGMVLANRSNVNVVLYRDIDWTVLHAYQVQEDSVIQVSIFYVHFQILARLTALRITKWCGFTIHVN